MDLKGTPRRALFATTLGFFFGFAAVSLYGPTAVKFKEALNLSPALVGLLIAIPSLSGSLLRIPFGAWVDTTGGKKPFFILMILSMIGLGGITLLLAFAYPDGMKGTYGLILIFGFLSGCGIATFSVGIGQTSYWFPKKKQGMALGVFGGVGNLAPGIFSIVLPVYLNYFGFISAYFAWFLFLTLGTVLYGILGVNAYSFQYRKSGLSGSESKKRALEKGQELFPTGSLKDSLLNSARIRNTWALVTIYFTTFGGFIALTAWFPTYWNEFYSFSPVKAGMYTSLFAILASALRVPGGTISDRFGGERVVLTGMVIIIIGSLILSFTNSLALTVLAILLMALGMGLGNAAVFKLASLYVPKAVGGAAGWIGGLGAFGGFVIPLIMGAIAGAYGTSGYAKGFIVFVVLASINTVIILFLLNRNPRRTAL